MNIEAHILCWNEAETIALTAKHYRQFCERVVFYDNFSDDNTRDIVREHGCEAQVFGIAGQLNDEEYLKVKNHAWKGSKADWVIVCDSDEILYHEDLIYLLKQEKVWGTSIFNMQGWQMYSNDIPREKWTEIKTGYKDSAYSKWICFDPKAVTDINYVYGCHEARPKGRIQFSRETLNLLHYKHIGGIDRILARHRVYESRKAPINRKWNLGHVYGKPESEQRDAFQKGLERSQIVFERMGDIHIRANT